jgi:hypothetical protein
MFIGLLRKTDAPSDQMIKFALYLYSKFPCHVVAIDSWNIAESQT